MSAPIDPIPFGLSHKPGYFSYTEMFLFAFLGIYLVTKSGGVRRGGRRDALGKQDVITKSEAPKKRQRRPKENHNP